MMKKVSAIIIARNEEKNIKQCIKSLNFAKEVIVIDNDSLDKTASIAKSLSADVYKVTGLDFSYLRNIAKEKARGDWLFYIDADEQASESLSKEVQQVLSSKIQFSAYYIQRHNYYLGVSWPKKESIIRLIEKKALVSWQGILHESPIVAGKIGQLKSPIIHHTHQTLNAMIEKTNEWSEIESTLRYQDNHPPVVWWRFIRVMFSAFIKSFFYESGFRAGTVGLIESFYQAFSMFVTYAKLWEKQNQYKRQ